jgi:capsular exopolysaccharide synthesis family protein
MTSTDDFEAAGPDAAPGRSRGFLTVLWQRKALVILATLLGLVGGSLFYWQRPPVYQSGAQILVIKKQPVIPVGNQGMGYTGEDYMSVHLEVIRSPMIIERAVRKKELGALKTFEDSGDPVGQIMASLNVMRHNKEANAGSSQILNLTFRGPIAEDCAKVLAAVIESYQEFLDNTYKNVSDQTVDLITTAREKLRKDKDEAEERYFKFRQDSAPLVNKQGVSLQYERVAGLDGKRSPLLVRQAELRERIKSIEKAIADGREAEIALTLKADTKMAAAEKALADKLLPLELQEKELRETFGDDHPAVISVRNRMELVRAHHGKKGAGDGKDEPSPVQRHLQELRDEQAQNDLTLQAVTKVVDEVTANAKDTTNYDIREESYRRAVAQANDMYEATIKRLKEIDLTRDSHGIKCQPLAHPSPGVRVAPSAFQIITGGLLLGILAGIGLAYLADLTDKSFRNPDEVRNRLGLPILGHVPLLKPDPEIIKKVETGELVGDPLLCALFKPKSVEAEACRAVRTALYFSTQGEGHRVLQVTSPNKGDGKSLMVGNLAISMARSGKKVLVIDADCRRPRQHKVFGLSNARGLTSVLGEGCPWQEAAEQTLVDGLMLMTSGPVPPNPSELLSSPKFKELLETVRGEFDYVIVDTPPLLAVTDPCVVAGRVDGLVLVLRLSRQGRPHAERAREILRSIGVKILGVVVNGITRQIGASIYSSDHYDYTESYDRDDTAGKYDSEYYQDDEQSQNSAAASSADTLPAKSPDSTNGTAG